MEKYVKFLLLFMDRHFWNRKCRKITWWQQELVVFKCEATVKSVTGHVCVNSNAVHVFVVYFTGLCLTSYCVITIINSNEYYVM